MPDLNDKTLFITGASRGIGRAIALRAAADGANIVIVAKTIHPHPQLPGTIHSVAEEVQKVGGQALAVATDIRNEAEIQAAVEQAEAHYGGIDILVNNASAISLTDTASTPMKRYDLMQSVNTRGTYACSQACLPLLEKAENPHILTLSPPISLQPRWAAGHVAYTLSKYGMSLCTLGMAAEFAERGIGVNSLWPRTVIRTAALAMLGGLVKPENCRKPDIVADAAHAILRRPARECSGNFFLDEQVLAEQGITDLEPYAVSPGHELMPDLFL